MPRNIKLGEIGDFMGEQIQELVKATTLEWTKQVKEQTPVDTGTLKRAWQTDVSKPYVGTITNNMEYAEPVCYGTNLPPSWEGQFKTRQGTRPGFPELIGKELESWAQREYQKIVRRG